MPFFLTPEDRFDSATSSLISEDCTSSEIVDQTSNEPAILLGILEEERRADCVALTTGYLEARVEESANCKKSSDRWGIARGSSRTPFHNKCKPKISLKDYIQRLAKFTAASPACLIMACKYIDRLAQVDELYSPNDQTVHRLILCGVLLAAKLTDDKFRSNAYYSRVGGVSRVVLNEMEIEMFRKLEFSCFLSQDQILSQLQHMAEATQIEFKIAESSQRRSKKRISEDVGFGSEDDLPAKVLHGSQKSEVTVTTENSASNQDSEKLLGQVFSEAEKSLHNSRASSTCASEAKFYDEESEIKISIAQEA